MSDSETQQPQLPCRHIRSKEMYYQGFTQEDDQFSSGLYWCTKTHESFGPDGQPVGKTECCHARTCFLS
jgi:hypothetical protein